MNISFITNAIIFDDMTIASKDAQLINKFKKSIQSSFGISFFSSLKIFLGWRITQNKFRIKMSKELYAKNLVTTHNMEHAKPALMILDSKADISKRKSSEPLLYKVWQAQ